MSRVLIPIAISSGVLVYFLPSAGVLITLSIRSLIQKRSPLTHVHSDFSYPYFDVGV